MNFWKQAFGGEKTGGGGNSAKPAPGASLIDKLHAFMTAQGLPAMKAYLTEHPELLSAQADELLTHAEDQKTKNVLEQHRRLLGLCRKIGHRRSVC